MTPRPMFALMEEVMQRMKWDWPMLLQCIYGLAKPNELSEEWVIGWLNRQINIINEFEAKHDKS